MFPRSRVATVPAVLAATFATALSLVAGCGSSTADASSAGSASDAGTTTPAPASATPAAVPSTTAVPAPPATTAPAPTPRPAPVTAGVPWPSEDAAQLQKAVDGGSEPWLLDPTSVAESYGAFREWKDVQASGAGTAGPTHVTVRSSAGTHTLTVAQPGRKGRGGIWVVTADSSG